MGFVGSYLWSLRQRVGHDLVLMPGSLVVLVDEAQRLLFQRRADTGNWEFPCGGAEPGGSFAATAVAEVAEETGATVDPRDLTPFGCLSEPDVHTVHYPSGDVTQYFSMCFEARTWSGALVPEAGEVVEFAWHDAANPPEPLQVTAAAALEMYRGFRDSGRFQVR